ncbi:MAG: endonuclease/exonuclease/phosphatase family protein [Stappiaceae bacterium]
MLTYPVRLATFNMESFGETRFQPDALTDRIAALRPILANIDADILCLQEMNAQKIHGSGGPREFLSLDLLLQGTAYQDFHRAFSLRADGQGPRDRHNLLTLSRFPIDQARSLWHSHVDPPAWNARTDRPEIDRAEPITWDRPILHTVITLPDNRTLDVFNLHLRAPIAAPIAGQKLTANQWRSTRGWAEGFFLSAVKRAGQALELRQAVDDTFQSHDRPFIALAGDFNADLDSAAIRIAKADAEDTGNPSLAEQTLYDLIEKVPRDQRYTILHHGMPRVIDHILVSEALQQCATNFEILNHALPDEVDFQPDKSVQTSFHAPVLADFTLPAGT